jgi:hypothetical protein
LAILVRLLPQPALPQKNKISPKEDDMSKATKHAKTTKELAPQQEILTKAHELAIQYLTLWGKPSNEDPDKYFHDKYYPLVLHFKNTLSSKSPNGGIPKP